MSKLLSKFLTKEIALYIFFGALTTFVGFSLYALFIFLSFGVFASNTISTFVAILFAYFTNKIWVFKSLDFSFTIVVGELAKFFAGRLFVYVLDTALLLVLVDFFMRDPIISKAITSIIVIVMNYLTSKKIVFSKKTM